jgi:hypothetical protein
MIISNQYIDSSKIVSIRYNRDFNQLQIDAGNFEYFFNISTELDFQTLYAYLLSLKNFEIVDIDDIESQVKKFESNMFGNYLEKLNNKFVEAEKSK